MTEQPQQSRAGVCEAHPDRVGYPTSAAAIQAAERAEESGRGYSHHRCPACGMWHITPAQPAKK